MTIDDEAHVKPLALVLLHIIQETRAKKKQLFNSIQHFSSYSSFFFFENKL